jgi:hypothetical protein
MLRAILTVLILVGFLGDAEAQSRRRLLLAKRPAAAAGTNSPATIIANLNRWYDASVLGYSADTAVGSTALWTNLAYAGDHLTQATGGNRPLFKTSVQNGLPGILFDGSDDVLTMTSSGTHNSGTAMAIFRITQSPASYTVGLLDSSGGSQELWMSRDGSGNVVARLTDTDGTTVESSDFAGDGTVITNAVMIGWAWDGSTVEFYRNGTNVGSSASAGGTVNMTLDRMGNANGLQFIGYMHEFAYWTNNKASDADMTSLWANYASNKWFAAAAPTATKLRIYINNYFGNQDIKLSLYDNGGALISGATGTATVTAGSAYKEVTLGTPASVTAGTTYKISFIADGNNIGVGYKDATGTATYKNTVTYASEPSANLPVQDGTLTRNYAVGIFVDGVWHDVQASAGVDASDLAPGSSMKWIAISW